MGRGNRGGRAILVYKMSGAGNDFVALAEPAALPSAETVRAWCRRGLSLGADGVFVIERREAGVRMHHFNADGGRAELCVNGTRCAGRLAFELGWGDDSIVLLTDAGEVRAHRRPDERIAVELEPPAERPREMTFETTVGDFRGWFLRIGVPHLVLEWDGDIADAPLAAAGPVLRHHPALGPAGANVDFVRWTERDRFQIRTWERGVEGETLACGSGILAAAAAGVAAGRIDLPTEVATRGGFELRVDGGVNRGAIGDWSLEGDARLVASLEPTPEAGREIEPPKWS